jgi:hypothetical protein
MIPIDEEDKARVEEMHSAWENDISDTGSLYRIAKAAIEFNKTAVPVFHIAEEDRRALENANERLWLDIKGCDDINAACHVAKAALEASKAINNNAFTNNAPKLTDINWAGLCDEKVWEDMLATGHLGAKTRGRTIAAEFQKCRAFAFSRPVVASADDAKERELKKLREENELCRYASNQWKARVNSFANDIRGYVLEIDSLKAELATLKEQANKPRVIRRF